MRIASFQTSLLLAHLVTASSSVTASSARRRSLSQRDDGNPYLYTAYNLSVPVDHFQNETQYAPHSNGMFDLRYWFDDSYYRPGGPVFVLSKGILYELSKATGGIGVVLEHRYYGGSFPTPDLTTENLRFLTTDQALADTAYFASHVVFEGHKQNETGPTHVPWIAYGGSYAGAFVAFLRKLYPDVFFGAISSSGVTEAIYDYWRYFEPIRQYGPPDCVRNTQLMTDVVDKILIGHKGTQEVTKLKTLFGLQDVIYENDFANALTGGIGSWQGRNWDPAVDTGGAFQLYCDVLSNKSVTYPSTNSLKPQVQHTLQVAGYGANSNLTTVLQNYIGYINQTVIQSCSSGNMNDCCSTHNAELYENRDVSSWVTLSWPYQFCRYYGFFQTGSGVPETQLPLISRTIDLNYTSIICRDAFNITSPPDTAYVNRLGGFNISYPRLAIIDGEMDPWRPATPHSPQAPNQRHHNSTDEPFLLIRGAVHHWDENGLFPNETTASLPPKPVADTQKAEVEFVREWLKEWNAGA